MLAFHDALVGMEPERSNLVFGEEAWLNFFPVIDDPDHGSRVSIHFKTREQNAIIVLAETSEAGEEILTVCLLNGSIRFLLRSPGLQKNAIVQKSQACKSPYSTCSDGAWHHLSFLYNPLRIFYQSREGLIDLIDLIKENSTEQKEAIGVGEISYRAVAFQACAVARKAKRDARSDDSEITFMRPGGYLRSQQGWRTVSAGIVTFKIRTLKMNCLLLFSSSGWPKSEKKDIFPRTGPINPVNPVDRLTGTDIFSAELREGYLVFLLNTGSGINEFATERIWRGHQDRSEWFVADGASHHVEIQLINGSLSVTMDGRTHNMRPKTKPKYEEMRDETPPQAWSARLREDFVGCLSALSIDGESLDLALEATAHWAKGYVRLGEIDLKGLGDMCTAQENPCSPGTCMQGSWSEPLCDCTQTNFVGSRCKEGMKIVFIFYHGIRLCTMGKQGNTTIKRAKFNTSVFVIS
ncbi:unnamed protein product [Hydatigera taeniaeformis]|uniref:LAM_G_DOMAIN domain-containing protein n=1 Tax=Hydatigena taeniaeformis TaxID=6205 RepID=A0A0R3XAA2_HYDTA|nr:unnamed protein product [Hydatigera taeniaeformis]